MKANSERMYWLSNKEWYRVNPTTYEFELTEKATPLARKSFAKWKRPSLDLSRLWKTIKYHII